MIANSEGLTPVEIKNKEFKKTLWGYSPKEVIAFLDQTAKAWEGVQRHERELLKRIEELGQSVEAWKKKEEELKSIRSKAESDAQGTLEEASRQAEVYMEQVKEKANKIREKTEKWLERVIKEVEETEKKKRDYLNSIRSTLDQHYELLNQDGQSAELEADLSQLLAEKEETSHPI